MEHFWGGNSAIIIFSLLNGGQLSRKEFAPFGANSFLEELTPFERASLSSNVNRKSQKVLPFVKMVDKHGSIRVHLKGILLLPWQIIFRKNVFLQRQEQIISA